MKIENLEVGMVVKNYKALCKLLEVEEKGNGKSKALHHEEFQRYFTYEKEKQKYIVTGIYEEPLEKFDNRKLGNNNKYVKHIEIILMHHLANTEGYVCNISKNNLLHKLGIVNEKFLKQELSKKLLLAQNDSNYKEDNISNFDYNHFCYRANLKLTRILHDALTNLKNRFLISYREKEIVVYKDSNGEVINREATIEEIKAITIIKREVLVKMGYESIIQVMLRFKGEEFYDKVNLELQRQMGLDYSYKHLEVIYTKESILEALDESLVKQEMLQLNNKVIETINTNAENNYTKNDDMYYKEFENFMENSCCFGKPNKSSFKYFKYKDNYINIQKELAEYLLRI